MSDHETERLRKRVEGLEGQELFHAWCDYCQMNTPAFRVREWWWAKRLVCCGVCNGYYKDLSRRPVSTTGADGMETSVLVPRRFSQRERRQIPTNESPEMLRVLRRAQALTKLREEDGPPPV
jgi:hypothetical protein